MDSGGHGDGMSGGDGMVAQTVETISVSGIAKTITSIGMSKTISAIQQVGISLSIGLSISGPLAVVVSGISMVSVAKVTQSISIGTIQQVGIGLSLSLGLRVGEGYSHQAS